MRELWKNYVLFSPWHILDVLLFLLIVWRVYKLLRGTIALNIFLGILLLYGFYWLVTYLDMPIMSMFLSQFVSVGVITSVIILQPEIRRFMMVLGRNTLKGKLHIFDQFTDEKEDESDQKTQHTRALFEAIVNMSANNIGAIVIIASDTDLTSILRTGIILNAVVSRPLIETIFTKDSALHDGALVIADGRIRAASCVLPLSDNPNIPQRLGLRHRSAVGVTETVGVVAFIVSEETGHISFARDGQLKEELSPEQLKILLTKYFV